MLRHFYFIVLLLLLNGCSNQYGIVEEHSVTSTTNGTSYKIEVLKPYDYDSNKNYKPIYLLDSQWHLSALDALLAERGLTDIIIVGIGYTGENDRANDYYAPDYPVDWPIASGQGELFHTFIRDELISFIETRYSCDTTQRTILGHSAGGYFVTYSLFHHYILGTTPFSNFISVSPGIFWANSYILGEKIATRAFTQDLNVSLYMSIGTLEGTYITAPYKALTDQILSSNYNNLNLKLSTFKRGHNSMVVPSAKEAIAFMFGN